MNSEDKFWLGLWSIVGIVVIVIISSITVYSMDHNAKVVELIKEGIEPVAALCAMDDTAGNNPTCAILASK